MTWVQTQLVPPMLYIEGFPHWDPWTCIKSLSEGKRPNFRDSKLTLLLQASMTAGKVIMIAALSPACRQLGQCRWTVNVWGEVVSDNDCTWTMHMIE
jgi:hypothetical protein